jgi:hypothetical protein
MALDLVTSAVAALVARGAFEAVSRFRAWRESRKKLLAAKEASFEAALASESLANLGNYLDQALGPFSVSEYAQDEAVRRRVDLFVSRLQEYVRQDNDVPGVPVPPAAPLRITSTVGEAPDAEFELVETKLMSGTAWDALATLRRLIEVRLKVFAEKTDVIVRPRTGAGKLIELLRRHGVMDDETATRLRYSVDVANRAIHGIDVRTGEAEEAIDNARGALRRLGLLGTAYSTSAEGSRPTKR